MVKILPCQKHDPDIWFSESEEEINFAKSMCESCPLKDKCYQIAVDNNETYGVWGGVSFLGNTPAPEPKTCKSGKHLWEDGWRHCVKCQAERDAARPKRKDTRKRVRKFNKLGGQCRNGHDLTEETTTIRSTDNAVICKKCISGQKTRDAKALASRKIGAVWQ